MIEAFEGKLPRVHPDAFVHPAAVLIGDVVIGAHSTVWPGASLRADDGHIRVGEGTSIQDGVVLHATEGMSNTTVGSHCTIGHNAILHGCTIEDDCLIGMGSILLDNAVIQRGAMVGAGTLVPPGKTVPADTVVMGSPFRVIRRCTQVDKDWIAKGPEVYLRRARQYLGRGPSATGIEQSSET